MEYIKTYRLFLESYFLISGDKQIEVDDPKNSEMTHLPNFNPISDQKSDHMIKYQEVNNEPVVDPHKINQNLSVMKFEKFIEILDDDNKKKTIEIPEIDFEISNTSLGNVFPSSSTTQITGSYIPVS